MSDDPRRQWKEGKTLGDIAGNPDGTFNGVKAMSAISGLKREVKGKPWLNPEQPPKPG